MDSAKLRRLEELLVIDSQNILYLINQMQVAGVELTREEVRGSILHLELAHNLGKLITVRSILAGAD